MLYLHGLGCAGCRDWPPVAGAPPLAGRASLWVDLLGFGHSDRPPEFSYDLGAQADLLAELLPDRLASASGRLVLIGHSMGGTLAVLLAERLLEQGRPPAAVLLAEPVLRPEDAGMGAQVASRSRARFLAAWDRWVQAFPSAHYQEDMRLADPAAFYDSAVSLVRHAPGMFDRFLRLPLPRGYILGGRSRGAARTTAEWVRAAGLPVETVARAGHGFSADDPHGFARAICRLLPN